MVPTYRLAADRPRCVFAFRGYTGVANRGSALSSPDPLGGFQPTGCDVISALGLRRQCQIGPMRRSIGRRYWTKQDRRTAARVVDGV